MGTDWQAELKAFGFPDRVIASAIAAREAGLFSTRPPEGLVERIVTECWARFSPAGAYGPAGAEASSSGTPASIEVGLKDRCDARQSETGMSDRGPR